MVKFSGKKRWFISKENTEGYSFEIIWIKLNGVKEKEYFKETFVVFPKTESKTRNHKMFWQKEILHIERKYKGLLFRNSLHKVNKN